MGLTLVRRYRTASTAASAVRIESARTQLIALANANEGLRSGSRSKTKPVSHSRGGVTTIFVPPFPDPYAMCKDLWYASHCQTAQYSSGSPRALRPSWQGALSPVTRRCATAPSASACSIGSTCSERSRRWRRGVLRTPRLTQRIVDELNAHGPQPSCRATCLRRGAEATPGAAAQSRTLCGALAASPLPRGCYSAASS